jgi:tetratricopeptide (TPR) repeat protein
MKKILPWLLSLIFGLAGCSHIAFLNRGGTDAVSTPVPADAEPSSFEQHADKTNQEVLIPVPQDLQAATCSSPGAKHDIPPGSPALLALQFQYAECLEGEKKFADAIQAYRDIAASNVGTNTTARRYRALALFRLASCYESIEQNELMVASLEDANKLRADLPPFTGDVEVFARLGVARARLGQDELAQTHFLRARSNIKKYLRTSSGVGRAEVALQLRNMGAITLRTVPTAKIPEYAKSLELAQAMLLQAVSLDGEQKGSVESTLKDFYTQSADLLSLEREPNVAQTALALIDLGIVGTPEGTPLRDQFQIWRKKFETLTYQAQQGLPETDEAKQRKDVSPRKVQRLERVKTR